MRASPTEEHSRLRPYLPRLVIQWLGETPDDAHREVEGSIAFVDISGFTKLSERLARKGNVGAEELADAIGTCFARLLGVAYGNGGGLIKFGGDALLILFTGSDHAAKASRAAVGMRRALKEIGALESSGARISLRMSVGIHSGAFHFFLVGDSHRELIVTGPAASETVLMESSATAGEIVVSPATAAKLADWTLGEATGGGRLLKREPKGLSPERADLDQADTVDLLPSIPRAVRERLLAGLDEPEHKRVTVAFLHYDGTDALIERSGPAATADHLHSLVSDVQRAVDRHGICFLGSDIDRDGGKIILTAGAPAATGNDDEKMLLALREIMDVERALPIRVGVNRGPVFAGDIGPSYRRTYTVMGDAVNLAARLMAKAQPGEILATETVLAGSRTEFRSTALEPFMVKGKAHPVQAHSVGAVTGARGSDEARTPLVGREREMQVLQAALDSARAGQGRVVEIIGEAGIGKSRLIEELRDRASGAALLSAACQLYESSTPYFPFRDLLRVALGLSDAGSEEEASALLMHLIETKTPHLLPWAPLIAIPLDVEVPSTPEADRLEDEFRRARLEEAVRDFLVELLPEPTLFTIEDAHWIDEASSDLLRHLTGDLEGVPWMFCITRRDVDTGFVAPSETHVDALRPEPLDASAATALVDAFSEESPLTPHEIAALTERSGGNPLFLKELLAAARAAGGIEGLPDSVEAVIMARIDRLAPQDRSLLRRLSVLGQTFDRSLAAAVMAGRLPSQDDSIWRRLGEFIGIEGVEAFYFRHALIRDGAYEGLPYRLRRTLHALVGETIERTAHGNTDDHAELLSMHFFHARRYDQAWRYSSIAAERARSIYANVEAAAFYQRAVEAARRMSAIPDDELARVYEALGDVRNRIGEYHKAADAYRLARRLPRGDSVAAARLMMKQGQVRQQSGRFPEALRWLRRAIRALDSVPDVDARAQRAQIAVAFASVHKDQGRLQEVIKWCMRAIPEAERAADKDALAHAYLLLDTAHVALGQGEKAAHFDEALALYEELGDLWGQGVVLNNLGTQAYWRGNWNEAVPLYDRARGAWEKIGDVVNAARGTINVGEVFSDQGRLEDAEPLFRKSLRVWKAAAFRSGVAYALSILGRLEARSGRFSEAMSLFADAELEFETLGSSSGVLETEARMAECLVFQGDGAAALSMAEAVLDRLNNEGGPLRAMLLRIKGWALELSGDPSAARVAFEESLRVGRQFNAEYEVALTQRALARTNGRPPGEQTGSDDGGAEILGRLGVVRVFEAPLPDDGRPQSEPEPALV